MGDLLGRFRRWCSWRRLKAAAWPALIVGLSSVPVLNGASDVPGWAGRLAPLLIGVPAAAVLAWALRRREGLDTPEGRWADFIARQVPGPNDIVCLFRSPFGIDLASVIIDRAGDRILFERCHVPRRWPLSWNERRYACRVSEIEGFVFPRKGSDAPKEPPLPLVVLTPRGRAEISADADGIAALIAFLESRTERRRHAVVDRPESLLAVGGGACVGFAAGAMSGLAAGVSDATLACCVIGGTFAGVFLARAVLDLADRRFGVDLGGPFGGAVKGASIALSQAVSLAFLLGFEGTWTWVPPLATVVGGLLGGLLGRLRSETAAPPAVLPLTTFKECVGALPGGEASQEGHGRIAALLEAQWARRIADPRAYVGDLLYEAVHQAHADKRGGAWQPEVEVSDGEVRVRCTWKPGSAAEHAADEPEATRDLLVGLGDFAAVLGQSSAAPWWLVVEFEAPAGMAALIRSPHPDPDVCRQLGIDRAGTLAIGIRSVPPSPASLPLPPLADVLRNLATRNAAESEETDGKRLHSPTTL